MSDRGLDTRPGGVRAATDADFPPPTSRSSGPSNLPSPTGSTSRQVRDRDDGDRGDDADEDLDDAVSSDAGSRSVEAEASVGPSSGGEKLVTSSQANLPPAKSQASFVHKVWAMLEDPTLRDYIAWSEDGKSFLVYNPSDFAREVLPRFFKHSNFSSFLRQCNFYNWSKVNDALSNTNSFTHSDGSQGHAWEFRNPSFQRGRPDLLAKIKRKTAKTNSAPSPALSRRQESVTSLPPVQPARVDDRSDRRSADSGAEVRPQAVAPETDASRPRSRGDQLHHDTSQKRARTENYFASEPVPQASVGMAMDEVRNPRVESPASPPEIPSRQDRPPSQAGPPHFYSLAGSSRYSPATRLYPLLAENAYTSHRHSSGNESILRQLETLENQVRVLGEALNREQLEHASTRATSYSVMQTLVESLSGLDKEDRFHHELQSARRALSRVETSTSPASTYPGSTHLAAFPSHWTEHGPNFASQYSTRPATATQFYYNRVPAAESYTRAAPPDARPSIVSHADLRPASSGSQVDAIDRRLAPGIADTSPVAVDSVPLYQSHSVSAYPHASGLAPITAPPIKREVERVDGQGTNRSLPPLSSLLNPVDSSHPWPESSTRDRLLSAGDERMQIKRARH